LRVFPRWDGDAVIEDHPGTADSERSFASLYERYEQPLYRYCLSLLRDESDAQDALQSSFTAAFAALRRRPPSGPLRPWLFRIAHNEAISLLRRRRPAMPIDDALSAPAAVDVEESVRVRAELGSLLTDLRALSERQRDALVMRELSGLSHDEIAGALGISRGAAKQTLHDARRSLAAFAAGRDASCEEIRGEISEGDRRVLSSRRVGAHLRVCDGCAAFAGRSRRRRAARLLAPPLPAAILLRLRGRLRHPLGASGSSGVATGKLVAGGVLAKSIAGVALVAGSGAGVALLAAPPPHAAVALAAAGPVAVARSSSPAAATASAGPVAFRLGGRPAGSGVSSLGIRRRTVPTRTRSERSVPASRRAAGAASAAAPAASAGHGKGNGAPGHGAAGSGAPGRTVAASRRRGAVVASTGSSGRGRGSLEPAAAPPRGRGVSRGQTTRSGAAGNPAGAHGGGSSPPQGAVAGKSPGRS
jgi:RNA polymerase sigma factor (sigma-70 family)